jgi:hypothetical protein
MDVYKGLASVVLTYVAHYGMVKIYSALCVPEGFAGFFQGFLMTGSPLCQSGVQLISATQVSYSTLITMGLARLAVDCLPTGSKVAP